MDTTQQIETLVGTMTAMPWHVGKHVAADPSGYNWRIDGDDIDDVIRALEQYGEHSFRDERGLVTIENYPNWVRIVATDIGLSHQPYTRTVLTAKGREQFLEVLRSVMGRKESLRDLAHGR